ncbi:MAG: hypothetical protein QM820_53595 [Minicystis sp.]
MPLSPADLAQLQARHLAFLEARLVSPAAEAEWRANLPAVYSDLLATKIAAIADAPAIAAALDSVLTSSNVERAARPLGKQILPIVLRELSAERGKLGAHVPAETRKKLDALLSRPAVFPDRALREIADQEAVQTVMRDVLSDGLKEFSEKVNPFIAEWGIPSLLKKMSLLGGAMTKGLESVRHELDRRMEPEIQRFLTGFTKKGLRRMVDAIAASADQPNGIALRKHMLVWALDQELAVLVKEVDAEAIALGQEIAMDIVAAEIGLEARKAQRKRLIEEAVAAAGDKTVGEVLTALGVTIEPDFEAIAKATWPVVKAVISGPAVKGWLEKMVREFYEGEIKAATPQS